MIPELGAEVGSDGRPNRAYNNENASVCDKSHNSHRAVDVCLIVTQRGTVLLLPTACHCLTDKL